ncbi:MAG: hypothetical protein AAGA18_02650 [Verrucomicrobiota bacterium]
MDLKEAKLILAMYRSDGQDALDPIFSEALELAKRDPDLSQWFEQMRSVDLLISEKMEEITPPTDLRDSLLTAHKVIKPAPSNWLKETWAIAAALVLSISGLLYWVYSQSQVDSLNFDSFANYSAGILEPMPGLDFQASSYQELKNYLEKGGWPTFEQLPRGLRGLASLGCKGFHWNGRRVSLICFQPHQGKPLHLFAIEQEAWQDQNIKSEPLFAQFEGWKSASWQNNGMTYLLLRDQPDTSLADFF